MLFNISKRIWVIVLLSIALAITACGGREGGQDIEPVSSIEAQSAPEEAGPTDIPTPLPTPTELPTEITEPVSPLEKPKEPTMAPTVGEHTEAVLTRVLGYDAARIAELRKSGALG